MRLTGHIKLQVERIDITSCIKVLHIVSLQGARFSPRTDVMFELETLHYRHMHLNFIENDGRRKRASPTPNELW